MRRYIVAAILILLSGGAHADRMPAVGSTLGTGLANPSGQLGLDTASSPTFSGLTLSGNLSSGAITTTGATNITAGGSLVIGSGGSSAAGSLYSDANWGMILRANTTSPAVADFLFSDSAGVERARITNLGMTLVNALTIGGNLSAGGAITNTPPINTQGIAFTLTGGDASFASPYLYNVISISGDTATAGGEFVQGLYLAHSFGGSGATGGRSALTQYLYQTAATSASNPNRNYVGIGGNVQTTAGDGGSVGAEKGAYFALTGSYNINGGTYISNATGMELNSNVLAGATVSYKSLLQLTGGPLDAVSGYLYDCMLCLSNQTTLSFNDGFLIGAMNGNFPIKSAGNILRTIGGTVTNGIDLSNSTISGSAFKSPGFSVSGAGAITTTGATNITAGGSLVIGSGGSSAPGSLYSDANWGMILTANTSPAVADFLFFSSAGVERARINNVGTFLANHLTIGGNFSAGGALNVVGDIANNGTAPTGTGGYVRAIAPSLSWPSLTTGTLTNVPTPTAADHAVPKAYADSIASGIVTHAAALAATCVAPDPCGSGLTGNLVATASGTGPGKTLTNNAAQAAFEIDGYSGIINDRILVKNQTATADNGIYTLTTVGTGATNWVLTRATDFDAASAPEVAAGASVIVTFGTAHGKTNWVETGQGPFTLETTPIIFSQVVGASASGSVNSGTAKQLGFYAGSGTAISGLATANNGVVVTDNDGDPSVSSTLPNATQDNITRLGTIETGVWSGTGIIISKGGTGADLSATGGASNVLKQASTGAAVTVGTLSCADLSNDAASCSTDTTNATNITSGTLPVAQLPAITTSSFSTTATNDNASAGKLGEFLSATGTAVAVTSATQTNITSLALTAGDWDVSGNIKFNPAATTTSTIRAGGLSLTSATLPVNLSVSESLARETGAITAGQLGWTAALGTVRVSTAGTPTVYCVGRFTFATSTATADCVISARRVR